MKKRFLSALLAMAMVLTMLPMSAFAVADEHVDVTAGLSADATAAIADIRATTGEDVTSILESEKAGNLLWFLVTDMTANEKYSISMKNGDKEVLTKNAITYQNPNENRVFASEGTGYLIYVSMDQASEDGESGQVNSTSLGDGAQATDFTVTISNATGEVGSETIGNKVGETTITLKKQNNKWVQIVEPKFTVASETAFEGKTAAEVQTGTITIAKDATSGKYVVNGATLTKIESWPEFNQAIKDEQSGYYLAIAVPKTIDGKNIVSMMVPAEDGAKDKEVLPASFTENNGKQCDLFIWMGATAEAVKNKNFTIKVKYGEATGYTDCVFDFSNVKVAGEQPAEYTITVADDIANGRVTTTPASKAAAGTEVTVAAEPATGYELDKITVKDAANKEVTVTNGKFTMPASNVTVSATFVKETTPVTTGIAAGFSWKAADANAARDEAIKAAKKTDNRENKEDALDQTVWFMVNEPVATADKGNHYWYEITDGTKVLWEGAMDYEASVAKLGMISASFLHNGQNEDDNTVPAKLVINVWKTDAAVTAKPTTGKPMTQEITTGANPLKIDAVTPNVAEKTVKVTFNQDLLGRYVIELKDSENKVVQTVTTECVAPTPAVAMNEGYTFGNVTLAAGKYTVNVYQAGAKTGAVTPAIDSKEVELKAETITEISTSVAGLSVAIDGAKIVLTGNMKKAAGDKTAVELSYKTSMNETAKTVVATYTESTKQWTLGAIDLFGGTTYTVDGTGVNFLANNVDIAAQSPEVEIKEEFKEALESANFNAATAVDADAADLLSNTKVNDILPKNEDEAKALLAENKIDVEGTNLAADKFTEVHVVSYFAVEVVDYAAAKAENGDKPATPATITLNITPMIKRVPASTEGAEPVYGKFKDAKDTAATVLTGYEASEPITFTVKLPTGFVSATEDKVIAKHYADDNKTTVKEWISTTVTEADGAYTASFDATTFSPYELTVDNRTATVSYTAGEGATMPTDPAPKTTFEVSDIGYVLPVPTKENATFEGWTMEGSTTKYKTLTEALFNELAKAEGTVELTANFTTSSSGGNTGIPGGIGGGSSGSTTYSVNVPTTEHGTVTVNPRNAAKDATVTITVAPNQGYHLDALTVTDKDGNNIELTKVDSNKYTFKMPASRVEVKATFVEGEAPAVSFTDVTEGEYYYDAVLWAVDKGITTGLTETTFGPNASCTRAQMVTFLWRAAGSPEPTATTTAFTDIDANEYYYKAVLWAVEKGITTGATETTFAPNATVTRAQTVTFLYRYAGKPAVSGNNNFTDLEAGEYYVDAVQWAATNGITTGTTETTFSPANNCTRGQIVTFLYRHIVK